MHETGVCRHIVDTVERYALEGHAKRVTKVNLEFGEVVIERVPFTVRCRCCGKVYRLDYLDEATWGCLACGQRDYQLHTGREFSIKSIEVEGYAAGEKDKSAERLAALEEARSRRVSPASLAVAGRCPAA